MNQHNSASLILAHHEVGDEGFSQAIETISRLMLEATSFEPRLLGMEQVAKWHDGCLDRLAITRAVVSDENGIQGFAGIAGMTDTLIPLSLVAMAISCATSVNRPAWMACEALSLPDRRFPDRGSAEVRLLFLPGAMLVIPDDDFAIENAIDTACKNRMRLTIGSIWTLKGQSNHAAMQSRAAADASRKLIASLLHESRRGIDITTEARPMPD